MNRNSLKTYAPQARRDFIQAMKTRAAYYGITETKITPMQIKGDVAVIGGQEHPQKIAEKRRKLEARIARNGFEQTMEALAYTWFNRFAAIRYMEVNEYLDHGYRVLSHPKGKEFPEILEHAEDVDLPGLSGAAVRKLKIEGNRERDIYRMVLVAQCNALNKAMPFLFEKIDDETELLLPDNLLNSDSIVGKLVSQIEEADWLQIEIVGWLYQFYISEKKDQVIGKVVKSEDIPAATQLFTPNWIVKYMVQNSLGAMWLATYPNSSIKAGMDYFVPPAKQTPEVAARIAAMTPSEIDPEKITFLDPAVGSGHIVVEAYDLLLAIYMDRGYQKRDAIRSILTKNLFGLDIDDRAAQMAGFALLMKARADDRTILKNPPELNIRAIQDSAGVNADAIANALLSANAKFQLVPAGDRKPETLPQPMLALCRGDMRMRNAIKAIVALFDDAKTFGSLLSVPEAIMASLSDLESLLARPIAGDLFAQQAHIEAREQLAPLLTQAHILGKQYDCVVANPPYMGMGGMNAPLKRFILERYEDAKIDTYAAFILRCSELTKLGGFSSLVTMHSWLFVFRFESFRRELLHNRLINSLIHLGPNAFPEITGQVVQVCAFVLQSVSNREYIPVFQRHLAGDSESKAASVRKGTNEFCHFTQNEFLQTPGTTISYWAGPRTMERLISNNPLESVATPRHGMVTSDNARYVRLWHEVDVNKIGRNYKSRSDAANSGKKWFPYNKGGTPCKWYGNTEYIVNWENDGEEIIGYARELYGSPSRKIQSPEFYFKSGLTWSSVTMKDIALRANGDGYLFDSGGSSMFFADDKDLKYYLSMLNSCVSNHYMKFLSPTINVNAGDLARIPIIDEVDPTVVSRMASLADTAIAKSILKLAMRDECWEFEQFINSLEAHIYTRNTYQDFNNKQKEIEVNLNEIQKDINETFISLYNLGDEVVVDDEVSVDDCKTLLAPNEWTSRLVSYAIGCLMGRYCLDEAGLIYAHSGNKDFDPGRYKRFPASDDGIVPLLDRDWGIQYDATTFFEKFIETAWPKDSLEANLKFVADSLGPNNGEAARDTIRRYLSAGFYKHHLSAYKKRPIYWLFSSGKERAFQCLVYLHRYSETTLPRIRMSYVLPLQGKIKTRIEQLDDDVSKASSTAHRRKLQKELDDLKKQLVELNVFEEKLRHFTDTPITLDLDDGVKVNYGKFGDLLAEAKAITGGKDDE